MARLLTLPDLGLGDQPIVLSLWLVKKGSRVAEGEPLVEVLAGAATVDLPSPADGVLVEKSATAGDVLAVGQRLGVIHNDRSVMGTKGSLQ
jgi:pyruvate/2-oxoglutarate dehydrogenase complex dihydrolipoamide acyltransferase (E2) component